MPPPEREGRVVRDPLPLVAATPPLDRRSRRNLQTRRLRFLAWTFGHADHLSGAGSGDAPTRDCYALLGVLRRANAVALKRAYRKWL